MLRRQLSYFKTEILYLEKLNGKSQQCPSTSQLRPVMWLNAMIKVSDVSQGHVETHEPF